MSHATAIGTLAAKLRLGDRVQKVTGKANNRTITLAVTQLLEIPVGFGG